MKTHEPKGERLLFVGNSITIHGPAEDIGWTGNWGMAASALEKDYVHLVVDSVANIRHRLPAFMVVNIADFERGYDGFDLAVKLKEQAEFNPDTVIVAIGENVPPLATKEAQTKFKHGMMSLLAFLKGDEQRAIYVRSSFWPDTTKDLLMQEACAMVGGVFIDISGLAKDKKCYARSERKIAHEGIGQHPGDRGMRAIADAILAAMWPNKSPEPTAVGAVSSAVAVHVASRRWLSFFR